MDCSPEFSKILVGNAVREVGIAIARRLRHLLNAEAPTEVTEVGISKDAKLLLANNSDGSCLMLVGITTLTSCEHPEKALAPMTVTVLGMKTI